MRGGFRPGAGRKPLEGERKSLTLRLPLDCIEILNERSKQEGVSRTEIVARLLRDRK